MRNPKFLRKLLPNPFLTLVLLVGWLILNNTISAGHILLGLILGWIIPWFTSRFWPHKNCVKQPLTLAKFLLMVFWDVVVANIQVAMLILGNQKKLTPGFIEFDLEINHPLGISLLANTISLAPGTVSCKLIKDETAILVHVLHMEDADAIIQDIRNRYEKSLAEVFTTC